ncbi:hypothetical protein [Kitasatospora sp. MAP5-34]|uniref:hypothetical protein n=1 Tax=Kitasatospora sp. MAP5-34 TaxID=3035102 RepID=UPI0024765B8E|nr:hypothetical protein [Kitasatospora sp. MAP5-34]MDH6577069.1 hypothetical protein [Kitasatospora sp. MAP5-34]
MNATPQHRSQRAERAELARLLPAVADPELSPHRHLLLKEHLMDTVTENSRRTARRRTLTLRVALPLGLAAAVAGVALTAVTGHAPTPGVAAPGSQSLGSVTNAAYSLESTSDDLVKLTIFDNGKQVDAAQLQHDLDRLGVRSHIYAGEPGCHASEPKTPSYPSDPAAIKAMNGSSQDRVSYYGWDISVEGRSEVLTVHPGGIPADLQLFIYFPYYNTDPAHGSGSFEAALMKSPTPSCMPARPFINPLASLYPTSKPTPTPTH